MENRFFVVIIKKKKISSKKESYSVILGIKIWQILKPYAKTIAHKYLATLSWHPTETDYCGPSLLVEN